MYYAQRSIDDGSRRQMIDETEEGEKERERKRKTKRKRETETESARP